MHQFIRAELICRRRMVVALGSGAFTLLLIVALAYQPVGVQGFGSAFHGHLPHALTALSGSRNGNWLTPHGWMGFGFDHPMFLAITLTASIAIGSASIAGEVDGGRAELLFSGPNERTRFLYSSLLVWLVAEVIVLLAALAGALLGALLTSQLRRAGVVGLLWAPVQYLPLALFIAACAMVASACSRTRSRALAVGVGIGLVSYLVNFVSGLIGSLAWLRWVSPFGYFDPGGAIDHGLRWGAAAGLLVASGLLLVVARLSLQRRDLA